MSVGLILGKRPEDCNDCKIAIHNEEEFRCPLCPYYNFAGFDSMVPPDECPLQEVEPVRHGQWVEKYGETVCSNCNWIGDPLKMFGRIMWSYCPYCGAKMDGGAE